MIAGQHGHDGHMGTSKFRWGLRRRGAAHVHMGPTYPISSYHGNCRLKTTGSAGSLPDPFFVQSAQCAGHVVQSLFQWLDGFDNCLLHHILYELLEGIACCLGNEGFPGSGGPNHELALVRLHCLTVRHRSALPPQGQCCNMSRGICAADSVTTTLHHVEEKKAVSDGRE